VITAAYTSHLSAWRTVKEKAMIAVVTDTCASLPPDMARNLQIELVPYYIHRGNETLRDLVDIGREEFFRWLPTANILPTTANPGPGDYLTAFSHAAERADGIVSIHMTSKGSGAYQSGCIAREMAQAELPGLPIEVIDTGQVSMVHGWAAIEAARTALSGASLSQVATAARHVAETGWMIQTADTLKYLYMGGRIGRAQHLVGSLLNVKPLIGMEDGIIIPLGQARSRSKAYAKMLDLMRERSPVHIPIKIAVTHVATLEQAEILLEMVEQTFHCRESLISELSPALGVHTGPGMVGVNFFPVPSTHP
jgi:DegV family protein with EDD domain